MENALLRKLITKYCNITDEDEMNMIIHLANDLPILAQSLVIEEMIADYYKPILNERDELQALTDNLKELLKKHI